MARVAGFVASAIVALALVFIMVLTIGEPKEPHKQIVYFIIFVIAVFVGWTTKRFILRQSAANSKR